MELFFSQFHLLRPVWLLMLIPALVLFVLLLKRRLASARWNGIIDESLMPHVLDQMPTEQARWPLWFILFAWVFTCIALSGPAWEQLPQPVQKKQDALVIVLDMSLSMAAQDVSPDRATRARQKVIDIVKQRNEGLTALVVYAGDAYTVTPLTDDGDTIINLVPALSPFIMPAMGSRPDKALALADQLIIDAGLTKAKFLLITDGIQAKDIGRIENVLGDKKQQLAILTIGTEGGAPIAMQEGGFKRDSNGSIVLPKLELETIKQLASKLNIRWHQMSFDDADWYYLLNINSLTDKALRDTNGQDSVFDQKPLERQFDLWADQGYWLIFIIIVIAALSFRRGWLLSLVFLITLQPETSYASVWDNAWQTKDQQAQKAFAQDPAKAAEMFEDSNWKASSLYRAKEYQQAADNFNVNTDASAKQQAESLFNRGNALAHAGELEKAIKAYEQSLALDGELADAKFNKALVEELLQQQEQQDSDEKENSNEQQDSDEKENSDEQKDSDKKQDSDQQKSDQEKSNEQKDSDSKDSEQQDSEKKDSEKKSAEEKNKENTDSDKDQSQSEQEKKAKEEREKQVQQAQAENELSREEKQALKQWLNRIPDDPGGLLKRKFLYQYKQRDHQDEGEVAW
jgi:Ca-activated chloride channel family protein